ncbi:hypothetical protein HMPREF9004_1078 [Schaalia cardiffensis F0333]|uniref:MoaB/Mog domain-containing protein n=1 Tax=Schaalia cardiffensis F0333 TaxID=888050 RepID=N6X4A8_9ACTO|nr:molybdopterin-binding protein [Schaalia cardiffensis]ENO18217.1 hypothetical protein HMPREF9004_1078 [Schaalia cardiffensis F0333]
MPQPAALETASLRAHFIVFSDRVLNGSKEDHATPACAKALETAGITDTTTTVVPEQREALYSEIRSALSSGARLVLVLGGSGFGVGNVAPEVVREVIEVEIPGIAEQIRSYGLKSTPLSGLSREVVGVTARDSSGALLVASPGSKGGALDTLAVLIPLLPAIYHQLDEER